MIDGGNDSDLLCGFEINDEFELCRLFDWQVGRLGTLEDLVDVDSAAPHKPPQ